MHSGCSPGSFGKLLPCCSALINEVIFPMLGTLEGCPLKEETLKGPPQDEQQNKPPAKLRNDRIQGETSRCRSLHTLLLMCQGLLTRREGGDLEKSAEWCCTTRSTRAETFSFSKKKTQKKALSRNFLHISPS